MSTQVARVMISHFLFIRLGELKPSLMNKLEYKLRDMNDFKVYLKFGILVSKGVKAMGGRNKDLIHPVVDKRLDVFPGQAFKRFLITRLADAFSTAVLLGAQDPEI